MLIRSILRYRLFNVDLFDFFIETMQIPIAMDNSSVYIEGTVVDNYSSPFKQIRKFFRCQTCLWRFIGVGDLLGEPCKFIAQDVRFDRVAKLDFAAIVETEYRKWDIHVNQTLYGVISCTNGHTVSPFWPMLLFSGYLDASILTNPSSNSLAAKLNVDKWNDG